MDPSGCLQLLFGIAAAGATALATIALLV